jgi:hypothetical protein
VPPPPPQIVINNMMATPPPMVVGGCDHGLHLLLTIFTFGWWLPVWIICALVQRPYVVYGAVGPQQPAGPRQRGVPNDLRVIVAVIAAVIAVLVSLVIGVLHPVPVFAAWVGAGIAFGCYKAYRMRQARNEGLRQRCEAQDRLVQQGNDRGVYGTQGT